MPTTRLQHPGYIVLNGETYSIARDKNGARLWKETSVPVQPGGGEKQVTFDTWHLGMGHSRLKQEGTYEYATGGTYLGGVNATTPWKVTIGPYERSLNLAGTSQDFHRLIEFNGALYAIGTTKDDSDLYTAKIQSDGTLASQSEVGAGQADGPPGQCAVWENDLYVGVTAGTSYKVNTSDTWTRGNACNALHFCRVGRDLWGVPLNAKGKISKLPAGTSWTWGTDDTALGDGTNWGALYNVGDTGQDIKSLAEWGRWLYVGKPEGLFSGDTDANIWNQLPGVIPSANNCLRLANWQGMLMAPTTVGTYRYMGLGARTQGIEVLLTNNSVIRGGYFRALTSVGYWLYGAYSAQDNNTYILAARLREADEPGVGELIWHVISYFSSVFVVSDMLASTVTTPPRIWFTFTTAPGGATGNAYYIVLNKDGSVNPNDSNYVSSLSTLTAIYLPRIDLNSPGTPKTGHFIEVHTAGTFSASQWIKLYANWDGGGWNQVGSTINTASTTFTRLFWTADSNDTGKSLQLRIDFQSSSMLARPELERLTASVIESPRREPAIQCSVKIADNLDKKRSAEQMVTDLKALFSGSTYVLADPNDPAAGSLRVILHDYEFVEREQQGKLQSERQCDLTLRVVEYA